MVEEKKEKANVEQILSFKMKESDSEFTSNDAILYALGLGFSRDPLDDKELSYTYELHENFQMVPSYGNCLMKIKDLFGEIMEVPGLPKFNPMMVLHGEQRFEIFRPLRPGKYINTGRVYDVADKGKNMLLSLEISTFEVDEYNRRHLCCKQIMSTIIRGIGGFGYKGKDTFKFPSIPKTKADIVVEEKTDANQAIIYRLSGDNNPLHIDPNMAAMGGFDKPILHGLCFYGIATKLGLKHFCNYDSNLLKSIACRFTGSVFPGETLIYSFWRNGNSIVYSGSTKERKNECIIGVMELKDKPKI